MEQDRVSECAYYLWLNRGRSHGGDVEDWLAAERMLATPRFDVVLTDAGENKIALVRDLRAVTGASIKAAQKMVEALPQTIGHGVTQRDAERLLATIHELGGTADLRRA